MFISRRRPGFSLIETLIVMALLATVAAIGIPRMDIFKYRADAGVVQVRSLLMQAQRDAIVRQHDLLVSIETVGSRLILGCDQNNDGKVLGTERIRVQSLPENTRFATPPEALGTSGMTSLGAIQAVKLLSMSNLPTVVFRRDGTVSTPLELYTTSQRSMASDFRVTTVVQATGRTTYLRYTGTDWKAAR